MNDLQKRIGKLPQWAQRYIGKLERDVASLKAEKQSVQDGDTKVYWCVTWDDENYLPDRAKVIFRTDGGEVGCKLRDGKLAVSGDLTLYIRPVGSNRVEVAAGV